MNTQSGRHARGYAHYHNNPSRKMIQNKKTTRIETYKKDKVRYSGFTGCRGL